MKKPEALRESFPLVFTSFVNKCGQIGTSLLPIFIIEQKISAEDGALALGIIKASAFVGTYLGGWCCDRIGLRYTLILSFLLTAVGLGALPLFPSLLGILVFGIIAQAGHAIFPSAARLMLTETLPPRRLQEGIGWLRSANNAGQIVSYSLGAAFATLGTVAFFYMDALTSVLAAILGYKMLPRSRATPNPSEQLPANDHHVSVRELLTKKGLKNKKIRLFLLCSIVIALFSLIYEMMIIGVAAKSKIIFEEDGLKLFAQFMVINTILCAILAVPASKYFKSLSKVLVWGLLMVGIGGAISLHGSPSRIDLFLGALFMTFGEIIFTSMAQFTLLQLTPNSRQRGALYSVSLILQKVGITVAGFITLPLVIAGGHGAVAIGVLTLISLGVVWYFLSQLSENLKPA
ncbi:MAG: MFS transporter [Bdellovibrionales bacterium]